MEISFVTNDNNDNNINNTTTTQQQQELRLFSNNNFAFVGVALLQMSFIIFISVVFHHLMVICFFCPEPGFEPANQGLGLYRVQPTDVKKKDGPTVAVFVCSLV